MSARRANTVRSANGRSALAVGVGDAATRSSPCSRCRAGGSARRASCRRRCRTARRPPRRAARRRRSAPTDVAPEAVRPLGLVHRHVVERAAVVGPRRRRRPLRPTRRRSRRVREVLDVQREVAPAGEVGRVGEPHRVARHGGQAEAKERLAARQLVEVEQGLVDAARVVAPIGRRRRAGAGSAGTARRCRVWRRVPPVALSHRHRVVVLLDAREHLLVELLLQRGVRREPGIGVGVLGLQVGERARIVAVAQPEVVVAARVAVHAHVARLARRARRRPRAGRAAHRAGSSAARQVAHRRLAVGGERAVAQLDARQRREVPAPRDEAQDRAGVVRRLVDEALLRERRDDDRRHPRRRAPAVALRHRARGPRSRRSRRR